MAEGNSGINFMAMLNPQFAAQQQKFALQQAMAQQMMQQGSEEPPNNQLANPGGMIIKNSPVGELARALEKGVGAYSAQKAIGDNLAANTNMANGTGVTGPNAAINPLMPTSQELLVGQLSPEQGRAMYETRTAGFKKQAEATNTPLIGPNGLPYYPKPNPATQINTPNPVAPPQTVPAPIANQQPNLPSPQPPAIPGANPSQMSPQGNSGPVVLSSDTSKSSTPTIPMAADGKSFIDASKIMPPDMSGKASFNADNTTQGVADAKDKAESLNKENTAFSQSVANFKNEGNQIDNLLDIYKTTQGGTLIAQHPEVANKLVALGIISDPSQISDVAGIQAAMNSHILDTLRQVRDANTSIGGPTSRIMAGEINTMLEDGASVKDQPEAMFKILSNAKGLVDYNMDMAKGWNTIGGTGNRAANGYTMPLSDYTTKYALNHDIQDYKANAQKTIGPLKGMSGNTGNAPAIGDIIKGHKFLGGDPSKQESWSKLP